MCFLTPGGILLGGCHEGAVVCSPSGSQQCHQVIDNHLRLYFSIFTPHTLGSWTPLSEGFTEHFLVSAGVKDSRSTVKAEKDAKDSYPAAERSANSSSSSARRVGVLVLT